MSSHTSTTPNNTHTNAAALRNHDGAAPPAEDPTQQQLQRAIELTSSSFYSALSRLMRGDTRDVEPNPPPNPIGNTTNGADAVAATTSSDSSSLPQQGSTITENAAAPAHRPVVRIQHSFLAHPAAPSVAAGSGVERNQQQQVVVRRVVRVPRGARITIGHHHTTSSSFGPATRSSNNNSNTTSWTVPVSELQPVVLRDQELRHDDDPTTETTTTTTTKDDDDGGRNAVRVGTTTATAEIQPPAATSATTRTAEEDRPDVTKDGVAYERNDLHHHRYKCSICYDYLDQPRGCGQCSGRFCATCLQQVLQAAPPHSLSGEAAKCPTCRAPFSVAVPDVALAEQLTQISLPCPYRACPQSDPIPLSEYQQHESSCAGVRVACRYAPYGCSWQGYRAQLLAHETSDCALARLPVLLEQLRTVQVQHREQVNAMQHQTGFLLHTVSALEATLNSHTNNNTLGFHYYPSNPLHLLAFVTTATTTTVRLVGPATAIWKNMYRTEEARASVFNTLALLPTVVLVLKIVTEGVHWHCRSAWSWAKVRLLLTAVVEYRLGPSQESAAHGNPNKDELEIASYLVEHLVTTFLVGALGLLIVICFYKDSDSSTAWTVELGSLSSPTVALPAPWRSIKILQWFVGCASCLVYYYTMELRGAVVGFLVLLWTLVATLVLPCFLLRVTRLLAVDDSSTPNPMEDALTPSSLLDQCRATRPLLVGLYFGLCLSVCGLIPFADMCLVAMLVTFAVRGRGLPTKRILVAAGVRGALLAASSYRIYSAEDGKPGWLPVLEAVGSSLICLLLFLIIFIFLQCLYEIGTKLGDAAYAQAKHAAGATGMLGSRPHPSYESVGAGVVACSTWVVSLLLLIVT